MKIRGSSDARLFIDALVEAQQRALTSMERLVALGRPSPAPRILRSEIKSLESGKPTTLRSSCAVVVLSAALAEVGRRDEARQVEEAGGPYKIYPDGKVEPE
jgi:hypothetical protein